LPRRSPSPSVEGSTENVLEARAPRRAGRPSVALGRAEILRAARARFGSEGFEGASVAGIAAVLGIRPPSLLHHFRSKEALYEAAVLEMIEELEGVLAAAIAPRRDGEAFVDRLDRLSDALTDYFAAHPEASGLLLRELGSARAATAATARADGALRAAILFVTLGIAEGAIPPADPVHVTLSVLGAHMLWFAIPEVSRRLGEADPASAAAVEARRRTVRAHARAVCGIPPLPPG
jgi:TetR/AcrR family transcriptional regulator